MPVSFNVSIADADANWLDGHRDLRVSAREVQQSTPIIGSINAKTAGRGNRVYTVSFSTVKTHATAAAAATWCGSHAIALGGEAAFSGFGLTLAAATCDVEITHMAGVTTEQKYTITGTATPA